MCYTVIRKACELYMAEYPHDEVNQFNWPQKPDSTKYFRM